MASTARSIAAGHVKLVYPSPSNRKTNAAGALVVEALPGEGSAERRLDRDTPVHGGNRKGLCCPSRPDRQCTTPRKFHPGAQSSSTTGRVVSSPASCTGWQRFGHGGPIVHWRARAGPSRTPASPACRRPGGRRPPGLRRPGLRSDRGRAASLRRGLAEMGSRPTRQAYVQLLPLSPAPPVRTRRNAGKGGPSAPTGSGSSGCSGMRGDAGFGPGGSRCCKASHLASYEASPRLWLTPLWSSTKPPSSPW